MTVPVIRRYFADPSVLAQVTRDFRHLIRAINTSRGEYTLQGMVAQMTGLDEPEPQVDRKLKQLFEALGNRGAE